MPRNINTNRPAFPGIPVDEPLNLYPATAPQPFGMYDPQPAINGGHGPAPTPTTWVEVPAYQGSYQVNTSGQIGQSAAPVERRKKLEFLSDKELADVRLKILEQVSFNGAPQTEMYEQAVALEQWVLGN